MKSKKVLFILPNLNAGGAEKVAVNYLRQINLQKYDVTLLVFKKTNDLLSHIPAEVDIVDIHTNSTYKSVLPLMQFIRCFSPHIVYTTHSRVAVLVMAIRPFLSRFRHIARMQGSPSLDFKSNEYGYFSKWLFSLAFRKADVVIAQTLEMRDDAIDFFGVNKNKTQVLNNPIDKQNIDDQSKSSKVVFSPNNISAVASGRLRQEKGFDILIRSVPSVLKEIPNFKLYILGDDRGAFDQLSNIIQELGLDNHVFLKGFISNPYLYYASCDLFILSSNREGFPNVLIENYYLNTPVVATRCVPIVSQLIHDGINGYSCNVGSIHELSECIKKCIELKRNDINNDDYLGSSLEALFE